METREIYQIELEAGSIVTLKPIPEVAECQCRKWRNIMYAMSRDALIQRMNDDLERLLRDVQAKAYVRGFRSGQRELLTEVNRGRD